MNQSAIPHNRDAEEAVVGAVLINPDILTDLENILDPVDIYIHRLRWIWEAYLSLQRRKMPIDILTVAAELDHNGKLSEVGGAASLTALLNQVPSSLNAESYAHLVVAEARRREFIQAANAIARLAYDHGEPVEDILPKAREIIEGQRATTDKVIPAEIAALDLMQIIDSDQPLGLKTGLPLLDRQIGAMPYGETILLVGDTTVGKTALSLQIAETISSTGKIVLYVSTESKAHTLIARRVCGQAGIAQKALRAGELTESQKDTLKQLIRDYQENHSGSLFFDDASVRLSEIERSVAHTKPNLIVVDHMGELKINADNHTLGILEAFNELRQCAKKHNAAQIVIHTIAASEANEKESDDLPSLNGLGWAKDLKYKGDIILGLYPAKQNGDEETRKRYLFVMKDREGPNNNKINLRFDPIKQWFTDALY